MPRNCLHDPTRIDLLFTMSEISQTASHKDSRCKAMFRGRIVLKPALAKRSCRSNHLVEPDGIEPTTSCLQSTRSPS